MKLKLQLKIILFGFLFISTSNIFYAQSFHDEVQSVFNFSPQKLTEKEQDKIFPILDDFFKKVIANKSDYLEPLREELKRNDNNPYFYYDGGILLMEISNEPSDLQLIADALVKTDLKDLNSKMYLYHLMKLSIKGTDVIDAALHIYQDPSFQVYIEQHALLLNQGECLKFILPRYESDKYVKKLSDIYSKSDSISTKESIISLLYYSRNCEADKIIESIKTNKNEPKEIKTLINITQKLNQKKRKSDKKKYQKIRSEIKTTLTRISDEAIYELNELTEELSKYYNCAN